MFSLRSLFLFIISLLLLSPLIRSVKKNIEKPIIIIAQDNSESILLNKDSLFYKTEYLNNLNDFIDKLKNTYDVRTFTFGDDLNYDFMPDFSNKASNYSKAIENIHNKFINKNIGAMVLAGDGLYNKGSGPLVAASGIKFPIYTIGLGDTSVYQDLSITEVNHNRFAFKGNTFPVRVNVAAQVSNGVEMLINISDNYGLIESKSLLINNDSYSGFVDFKIKADKTGLQRYTINIPGLDNEINTINNSQKIVIDVIDSKQKILILYNSPHPDVAALNNALSLNINYDISISSITDFSGEISNYNLVVMHQLPSVSNACTNIMADILKFEIPVLYNHLLKDSTLLMQDWILLKTVIPMLMLWVF